MLVMLIVTQFVLNVECEQKATGHTECQAEYVYEGIDFVSEQIAQRNF